MMYCKLDVFKIVERKDNAIYKTKKVAYHWFQVGKSPETNVLLSQEIIQQNKLPAGEYVYCSTMDYVIDATCPTNGVY